jgi:hypothetical protein
VGFLDAQLVGVSLHGEVIGSLFIRPEKQILIVEAVFSFMEDATAAALAVSI